MPWYIYLACKQLFPSRKQRISFFALVSIIGVAIGVGVLYGAMSVMNGFQYEIRQKLKDTHGDILVQSGSFMRDWQAAETSIEAMPAVRAANPYIQGVVMFQFQNRPAFPGVWAIDPLDTEQVIPYEEKQMIIRGSLEALDDESVMLSSGLAAKMGATVGDTIDIYTPLMVDRLKRDEVILPRELEVAAIFETGWGKTDQNTIVVTIRLMQDLYAMGDDVHGLIVRLNPNERADHTARDIEAMLGPPHQAYTWLESNHDFLNMLALEKAMIFILTLFIILVASFSLTSTLLTSVFRKTREIGLLGALGARPIELACIYFFEALLISVPGLLIGLTGAWLLLENIDPIVQLAFRVMQVEEGLIRFYNLYQFPVHHSLSDLGVISVATIILTSLAGILPAVYAARKKPATALRHE